MISKRLAVILIFLLTALVVIDIALRTWFFYGVHLKFDAANFNNILTPVVSIVSIVIYAYTLLLLIRQNELIQSQNLKPHFEEEFKRVGKIVSENVNPPLFKDKGDISGADITLELIKAYHLLLFNNEFTKDKIDYHNNLKYNSSHYEKRGYIPDLKFLMFFSTAGLWHLEPIVELVNEVNNSPLHRNDKIFYRKRIKNEFVQRYLDFIETYAMGEGLPIPMIQDVKSPTDLVEFRSFFSERFKRDYSFFKAELARVD